MLPGIDTVHAMTRCPGHDEGRLRKHCKWVDVISTGSMGCRCPHCLYGQDFELRTCCSYVHEPVPDDELHIELRVNR